MSLYLRQNERTLFLFPALAVGMDDEGQPWMEFAWLCWAVGIGSLDD